MYLNISIAYHFSGYFKIDIDAKLVAFSKYCLVWIKPSLDPSKGPNCNTV